jgi:TonB family protein
MRRGNFRHWKRGRNMRRLLISIGAFLGLLSVSFIAFHNACEHESGLSKDKAGTASVREPNANSSASAASQAPAPASSAVAVSSGNRDDKEKSAVSKRNHEDEIGFVSSKVEPGEVAAGVSTFKRTSKDKVAGAVQTQLDTGPPGPPPTENEKQESLPPGIIRKSGGVLQGSATKRVEPSYPPLAKAASVSGPVVVEVTVDEFGSVISARAISGHPMLKDAAVDAARGWRFTPTLLSGAPVKVIGTITFNFNL